MRLVISVLARLISLINTAIALAQFAGRRIIARQMILQNKASSIPIGEPRSYECFLLELNLLMDCFKRHNAD